MSRTIILHQLNAPDVPVIEFIELAAQNGCGNVTLFAFDGAQVLPRSNAGLSYPAPLRPEMKSEVAAALSGNGVSLEAIEFFPLTADVDLDRYKPALALGAELGAKRAVTFIFIEEDALVAEKLGRFCDLAATEGLRVSSEFCPLTPGNPSLERARWLVDAAGRDNFGIGLDMLHVVRSGVAAEDLAALAPRDIGVVQICDAFGSHVSSDYFGQVHHREVPGTADLPLFELLSAIPAACPIEIEVPAAHRRAAGVLPSQHVRDVIEGTRTVVAGLKPTR